MSDSTAGPEANRPPYYPFGMVTMGFAGASLGFGAFSLGMVALQRLVLSAAPASGGPNANLLRMFEILHGLWLVWMPLMLLGGALAFLGGWWLKRGEPRGRRLCQAMAVYALAWTVGYTWNTLAIGPEYSAAMAAGNPIFSSSFFETFLYGGAATSSLMMGSYPVVLLWRLSKPK